MIFMSQFEKTNDPNVVYPQFIHYMPFDTEHGMGKTVEELEAEGVLVESIPNDPEPLREDIASKLTYNLETKEFAYEYVEIPPRPEDMQVISQKVLGQQMTDIEIMLIKMNDTPTTMVAGQSKDFDKWCMRYQLDFVSDIQLDLLVSLGQLSASEATTIRG